MLSLLSLVVAPFALGAEAPPAGTLLTYRGGVAQMREDRTFGEALKTFDLTLLVASEGDAGNRLYWTVDERGRGAWPWLERFGSLACDASWRLSGNAGPALLYDLGESTSAIPIPLPLFATQTPLAAGATWERSPWRYEVQRAARLEGHDTWQVQVSNNYGPKRVVWVQKDGPLCAGIDERVFMGMGQEYQLQLRLVGSERLADEKFRSLAAGFEALLAAKAALNRPERSETLDLNAKQLATLAEQLPAIEKLVSGEPLEKIVKAAQRDLAQQNNQADAVKKLVAEHVGRQAPQFDLRGLSNEAVTHADVKNQVTVLHFWEYRDAPLKEPYGQVGYLDFLYQRRKPEGVKVYGVAVDGRLADEAERGAALRGIRKLKSFMNLNYPILLDGGAVIKQFGDPRLVGAELPLVVVIGRDGKIAHYKVGYYEVDRNAGLKELDTVVGQALQAKP
jgi:peroxiredoxin